LKPVLACRQEIMRVAEMASTGPIALLDAGVLRDMATSLSGLWLPATELDRQRAQELVAAARLRLYGDRDRSGWLLMTTRAAARVALRRGNADWSVGMVPVVEDFDDAPPEAEVAALAQLYRGEQLSADAATTLAAAVLVEHVNLVVTREPRAYRHDRAGDLPSRLEVVDVVRATDRLDIVPGEQPAVSLPVGSMLERGSAWWVPA
jgi:hypothetical protein